MKKELNEEYLDIKNRISKRYLITFKKRSIKIILVQIIAVLIFFCFFMINFDSKITGFLIKSDEVESGTPQINSPSPSSSLLLENPSVSTNSPAHIINSNLPKSAPNFQDLPNKLSNTQIIKDFPDKAVVSLRFFTFIGGQRLWQNEYIIKKASVVEGKVENPDVIIILHSKYLNRIYNEDLCMIMQDAKKNGDLGFDTQINKIALAWEFKSLAKYKSCIS